MVNKFYILTTLFALFFTGCASLEEIQNLNPAVYYRNDICFTYETGELKSEKIKNFFKRFRGGKYRKNRQVPETATFCGVGVLPYMDDYKITIQSKGKLDFFAITTCHEETTSEKVDAGWFKKNGVVGFTYTPTMERGKACPMYISAYDRRRKHGFGIAVFENPRYQLKATLYCNGKEQPFDGVSVCESRQGLIQKIVFDEPVKLVKPVVGAADRKKECPMIGEDYQKEYTFQLPERECWYGFIGKDSKKIHQFLAIGYEEVIIRE